jgi:hypothetical protein
MSYQPDIPAFPVTGWEIRTVPAYDAVMISHHLLLNSSAQHGEPDKNLILTRQQTIELIAALQRAVDEVQQSADSQGSPFLNG